MGRAPLSAADSAVSSLSLLLHSPFPSAHYSLTHPPTHPLSNKDQSSCPRSRRTPRSPSAARRRASASAARRRTPTPLRTLCRLTCSSVKSGERRSAPSTPMLLSVRSVSCSVSSGAITPMSRRLPTSPSTRRPRPSTTRRRLPTMLRRPLRMMMMRMMIKNCAWRNEAATVSPSSLILHLLSLSSLTTPFALIKRQKRYLSQGCASSRLFISLSIRFLIFRRACTGCTHSSCFFLCTCRVATLKKKFTSFFFLLGNVVVLNE